MTAAYKTLYQCNTCHSTLSLTDSETLESTTCACGRITIKQELKAPSGASAVSVHVKHQDMQPVDPGPYMRRALI